MPGSAGCTAPRSPARRWRHQSRGSPHAQGSSRVAAASTTRASRTRAGGVRWPARVGGVRMPTSRPPVAHGDGAAAAGERTARPRRARPRTRPAAEALAVSATRLRPRPRARAGAAGPRADEPLEDPLAVRLGGTPAPGRRRRCGPRSGRAVRVTAAAPAVPVGVVEQVDQGAVELLLVDADGQARPAGPPLPSRGRQVARAPAGCSAWSTRSAGRPRTGPGCAHRRRGGRARGGPPGSAGAGPARSRRGRAPAGYARGSSSRRPFMTWTLATRVVSGERSSWPRSAANRASRWIRSSRASTMLLNEPTMMARSGSSVGGSRVCSPPAAIRAAAVATSSRGAIRRREATRPSTAPPRVVRIANDGEHRGRAS